MGIFRSSFSFLTGTVFGVYLAQNYQVPNIKKLTETAKFMAEEIEEKYRKPRKQDGDDNNSV
ncbi:short transmembrane mitochondrial protein 1-like [Neltuma alba]|uniref:short transmembrane mitochondrial protein 1-like n=1 Tax=Neltuma alba TaxID=207710 RepID=UPI0010A58071|nr:short transmembrane mitochondrial protein 1-like [Prosopis alba]XP_028800407.1 short transmembrane mitochondrial protein 1-like [Prosopis alba]